MREDPPVTHLLDQPHHDGSALYVEPGRPRLGDRLPVRLRVPRDWGERTVYLRANRDGDPLRLPARLDRETAAERWYVAELPVDNPRVNYRWLIARPGGYDWLTARGVTSRDVTDAGDFRVTVFDPGPDWMLDAVGYQIFPDRFARSAAADARPTPSWARPAAWDDQPLGSGPASSHQFFGGDLDGIVDHLDYLRDLGVNLLYLTPFFPGDSVHRYDAATFDAVDPALGGDAALVRLTTAAHAAGLRVIGDITTNHTGATHEWFRRAQDPTAPERDFYYWRQDAPIPFPTWNRAFAAQDDGMGLGQPGDEALDYITWLGAASLPKLNWGSAELRRRLIDGPDAVLARYLGSPFHLDGWRVDVAHMTGRYAGDDHYDTVARLARATVDAASAGQALLIAEHFYDLSRDLDGDGWQSVMNYSGFIRPVWTWLTRAGSPLRFLDLPLPIPRRSGVAVVATARDFASLVPWTTTARQWNMLGSHDTPRIATVTGDAAVTEVGAAWLFTYPGIPAFFAGDEGGAQGLDGESSRSPMPWAEIARGGGPRWDGTAHDLWRDLIQLRHAEAPLRHGGLRWALIADDALGYLRETAAERLLVVLARAPWRGAVLPGWLSASPPEPLYVPRRAAPLSLTRTPEGWACSGEGPGVGIWRLG